MYCTVLYLYVLIWNVKRTTLRSGELNVEWYRSSELLLALSCVDTSTAPARAQPGPVRSGRPATSAVRTARSARRGRGARGPDRAAGRHGARVALPMRPRLVSAMTPPAPLASSTSLPARICKCTCSLTLDVAPLNVLLFVL